jgi:DNA polymerase I-like protein with 3'-5' exonuclease and polymerase domains
MTKYYYITKKQPDWEHPDITITDKIDGLIEMFNNNTLLGLDTENNSINPFKAKPLLFQLSDGKTSYVVNVQEYHSILCYLLHFYNNKQYILHNAQYDYKIIKQQYGVELRNLIDTMVIEQILGRGSGRSNNLETTHLRRLGSYMPVPKTQRDRFTQMGENPIFELDDILYSAYDPICLFPIYEVQKPLIEQYGLQKRIYDIAFPLIPILGDMCLEGFTLDEVKWKQILEENKRLKFDTECKLDEEIRKFSLYTPLLRHGRWTRKRRKVELLQTDLFGNDVEISNENLKNISYGSNKDLKQLFGILKQPFPEKVDKDSDKPDFKFGAKKISFAEEALEQYKITYPSSKMRSFIDLLIKYKELDKAINSFGNIFLKDRIKLKSKSAKKYKIGYRNPITNKVHTIYKQEFTKNGRLSSGDVEHGFYNSQQMIKEAKYRNCFTLTQEEIDNDWWISTYDLAAAELVILASNSGDKKLIEIITKDEDLHSYLATSSYTKIIRYIINNMPENRAYDELYQLLKANKLNNDLQKVIGKTENGDEIYADYTDEEVDEITKQRVESAIKEKGITIHKKKHVDIRNPYKNVVYGVNYGAAKDKIAETLNVPVYYGELILDGMRNAIPQAFAYLDRIAREGVKNGYIIFNKRTNSRHWFKAWLDSAEQGRELYGKEIGQIQRAAKNYGISGTQADMLKEAMVELHKVLTAGGVEFKFLLSVHDELVIKHKGYEHGKLIGKTMTEVCNYYLNNISMKVSGETKHYWHK